MNSNYKKEQKTIRKQRKLQKLQKKVQDDNGGKELGRK